MPARLARLCAWPWWKGGKELPGGDCCVGGCCGVPGLGKARWLATSEGSYDNCAWEWERNEQEVESQSQLLPMQASSGSSATASLHLVHRIHDVSPTRKVRSTHPNPAPGGLCGSLLLPPPWCGQLRCGSISTFACPTCVSPRRLHIQQRSSERLKHRSMQPCERVSRPPACDGGNSWRAFANAGGRIAAAFVARSSW